MKMLAMLCRLGEPLSCHKGKLHLSRSLYLSKHNMMCTHTLCIDPNVMRTNHFKNYIVHLVTYLVKFIASITQ
jgi:hypothetical protein